MPTLTITVPDRLIDNARAAARTVEVTGNAHVVDVRTGAGGHAPVLTLDSPGGRMQVTEAPVTTRGASTASLTITYRVPTDADPEGPWFRGAGTRVFTAQKGTGVEPAAAVAAVDRLYVAVRRLASVAGAAGARAVLECGTVDQRP